MRVIIEAWLNSFRKWRTRDGRVLRLRSMEEAHLQNLLAMCYDGRLFPDVYFKYAPTAEEEFNRKQSEARYEWRRRFEMELARRGVDRRGVTC